MTSERLQLEPESLAAKWVWLLVVTILFLSLGVIAVFAVLTAEMVL